MDALASRYNNILKVRVWVDLSFHKLRFIKFKLGLDDVANLPGMS